MNRVDDTSALRQAARLTCWFFLGARVGVARVRLECNRLAGAGGRSREIPSLLRDDLVAARSTDRGCPWETRCPLDINDVVGLSTSPERWEVCHAKAVRSACSSSKAEQRQDRMTNWSARRLLLGPDLTDTIKL